MNFDFYDIFSKIIPGGIMLMILLSIGYIHIPEKPELGYLFIAYLLGFLIDAFAANDKIQNLIWWFFRGKPASLLLSGNRFYGNEYKNLDEIKLKVGDNWNSDDLLKTFNFIYFKTMSLGAKRVQGFNNHWLSARNILITIVLCFMPIQFLIWDGKKTWFQALSLTMLSLFCLYILFDRAKNRQYYFVKEVLDSYLYSPDEKDKKVSA